MKSVPYVDGGGCIRFEGRSWPDPESPRLRRALWRARYGPDNLEPGDYLQLARAADSYIHLTTHPAPTAFIVKALRQFRRILKRRRANGQSSEG